MNSLITFHLIKLIEVLGLAANHHLNPFCVAPPVSPQQLKDNRQRT